MRRRLALLAAASAVGLALLTGCQPEPEPTPAPTGFADEAEAFAAAEATYRAYVDALNQVDLSDPATFEEVYKWTTGDANAEERESLSRMHAEGWTVTGDTEVTELKMPASPPTDGIGRVVACVDVSEVKLVDAGGQSQVEPNRPRVQTILVEVSFSSSSPTSGLIEGLRQAAAADQC